MINAVRERTENNQDYRFQIMRMEDQYRKQILAMACTLVSLVDLRDFYTGGHSSRVATYARAIGVRLGLADTDLDRVVMSALLHDIGKIGVPDRVLLKPGKLTDEEFDLIKTHTAVGARILRGSRFRVLQLAEEVACYHHEKWNGGGYLGLQGESIPKAARTVAVA